VLTSEGGLTVALSGGSVTVFTGLLSFIGVRPKVGGRTGGGPLRSSALVRLLGFMSFVSVAVFLLFVCVTLRI